MASPIRLVERAAADAAVRAHVRGSGHQPRQQARASTNAMRGFRRRSTRTFDVGGVLNHDVVMVRHLSRVLTAGNLA